MGFPNIKRLNDDEKEFVFAIHAIDSTLACLVVDRLREGETLDEVKDRLRRCMDAVEQERA